MCHEANCFKIYISKSGLFKHKKHMSKMHKTTVFCVWTVKKLSKVKRTVTIISVQQVFKKTQRGIKLNHRTTMKVKANVPHMENTTQEAVKYKKRNKCFHLLTDYSGFPYGNRKKCYHSVSIAIFKGTLYLIFLHYV